MADNGKQAMWRALAMGAGVLGALAIPATAYAEEPVQLNDSIVDGAGVLDNEDAIRSAIDKVKREDGIGVYIATTQNFGSLDSGQWCNQTAQKSGLTRDDYLICLAEERPASGTRANVVAGRNTGITAAEWQTMAREFGPKLTNGDWDGGVLQAVELIGADTTRPGGTTGTSSRDDSSSGGSSGLVGLLGLGALGIGGVALYRGLKKRQRGAINETIPALPGADPGLASLPTEELNRRAAAALVKLDDDIRAADQELTFAQAEFGPEQTADYSGALGKAREKAAEAFRLRQLLDDDVPEPEVQQREMLAGILTLTDEANRLVGAQAKRFREIRELQADVPRALARLSERAGEIEARLPIAQDNLTRLSSNYAPTALATVRTNVDEAARLISASRGSVASAETALAANNRSSAVTMARAADQALNQAWTLLDAVDRAGEDLVNAEASLAKAIASISADLSDVQRLAPGDAGVAPAARRAEAAVTRARQVDRNGDPLGAIAELTAAERELDLALQGHRDRAAVDEKARGMLNERMLRADGRLRSIDDFIQTRRGAVQQSARTRISEALRMLDEARQSLSSGQGQLDQIEAHVQRAEDLGEQAFRDAQQDVDMFNDRRGGGFGGGWGGGRGGIDPTALILGGILFGGGGHGHGGGWGGGGGGWGGGGGGDIFGGGGGIDFGGGGFDGGFDF